MSDKYILDKNGNPVVEPDLMKWATQRISEMKIETKIEFEVINYEEPLSKSIKKVISLNLSNLECEVKRLETDLKDLPGKRLYISQLVHKANIELERKAEIKVSFIESLPLVSTQGVQEGIDEMLTPDENYFKSLIK